MMKKIILLAIILLTLVGLVLAKKSNNKEMLERVSMMYIDGFYQGDTDKLKNCLDPELIKFGYWKDKGKFGDKISMTFEEALTFARNVKSKKRFPAKDAPKKVEVIDQLDKIAITKVTAWWGIDYMLLTQNNGKWMIRQVIWEGPDKEIKPSKTDITSVKKAGLNYIEGFYEGDTAKLTNSLKPSLYKFGYSFDPKKNKYKAMSQMTFDKAINFAKDVKEKKWFPKPEAPKKVEILEVRSKIAAVKITAWWGYDYMLLSKTDDKWMIEQVLWAGYSNKNKS